MKSRVTDEYRSLYAKLPTRIQRQARQAYLHWQQDHRHPGLGFKRVGINPPVYSVRIGIGWRALGVMDQGSIIWFWIGPHAQYDHILAHL